MSAENVALMWAACAREDADRTTWLVLAGALDEAGPPQDAAPLRAADYRQIGERTWPERVPGWFLAYEPDADSSGTETFYGTGSDGTYFVSCWGLVVKGEALARELVADRMAALGLLGFTDTDFVIQPFDFGDRDTDNEEEEDLAD